MNMKKYLRSIKVFNINQIFYDIKIVRQEKRSWIEWSLKYIFLFTDFMVKMVSEII